jgi:antitoxin HigA-1
MSMHNPPHPGLILREWLTGTTVTDAALSLGITRAMLSRILNQSSSVSADMDLRLAKALGTSPGFWLGLQGSYDLWQAKKQFKARIRPIMKAPAAVAPGMSHTSHGGTGRTS